MKSVILNPALMPALFLGLLTGCLRTGDAPPPPAPAAASPAPASVLIDLDSLQKAGGLPAEMLVDIATDHVFKSPKTYRAFSLKDVLATYVRAMGIDSSSDAVVTFICVDGYKPTNKLRDILNSEGFLAYRDEALTDPKQYWPDSIQGKFRPFYLVWKDMPYEDQRLNWPYGLFQLRIDKVDRVYEAIYPKATEAVAGFQHFQHYCIKCHSVNLIGGDVGPEFNYPKNITEYWDVENMWAYAKDPRSFRANARMEAMTSLTRREFDEIITYLRYMKGDKMAYRAN